MTVDPLAEDAEAMSPAAAEVVAALRARGVGQALPVRGAQGSGAGVGGTELRRLIGVDQVVSGGQQTAPLPGFGERF